MTMDQQARALVAQLVAALAPTPLPLAQQREEDALPDIAATATFAALRSR